MDILKKKQLDENRSRGRNDHKVMFFTSDLEEPFDF